MIKKEVCKTCNKKKEVCPGCGKCKEHSHSTGCKQENYQYSAQSNSIWTGMGEFFETVGDALFDIDFFN